MSNKQPISAAGVGRTPGAYSEAIRAGDFIFLCGQGAVGADGHIVSGSLAEQIHLAVNNIEAVLRAAGADLCDVVRTTVYLRDISDFTEFDSIYAELFPDPKPVRTTVQAVLVPGFLVEFDIIAYKPSD